MRSVYNSFMARPRKGDELRVRIAVSIDPGAIDKLDRMAFADRLSRSDLVNEAVSELFAKREAERGTPYPVRD